MATREQIEMAAKLAAEMTNMIGDAIRELDHGWGAPNGPIYATVMGVIDLATYNAILDRLVREGKIRKTTELLYWTGPR